MCCTRISMCATQRLCTHMQSAARGAGDALFSLGASAPFFSSVSLPRVQGTHVCIVCMLGYSLYLDFVAAQFVAVFSCRQTLTAFFFSDFRCVLGPGRFLFFNSQCVYVRVALAYIIFSTQRLCTHMSSVALDRGSAFFSLSAHRLLFFSLSPGRHVQIT